MTNSTVLDVFELKEKWDLDAGEGKVITGMPGDIVIAATAIVAKENAEATVSDVVTLVSTIANELQGDFDDDYEEEMPAPKEKKDVITHINELTLIQDNVYHNLTYDGSMQQMVKKFSYRGFVPFVINNKVKYINSDLIVDFDAIEKPKLKEAKKNHVVSIK